MSVCSRSSSKCHHAAKKQVFVRDSRYFDSCQEKAELRNFSRTLQMSSFMCVVQSIILWYLIVGHGQKLKAFGQRMEGGYLTRTHVPFKYRLSCTHCCKSQQST
jgi:hypothetical protein